MIKFLKNIINRILSLFNLKLNKINFDYNLPVETDKEIIKFINISSKFSMTGHKRLHLLSQAILNVKNNKLEGDFVECGVWMGGNILLFKLLNDFYNSNKSIFDYQ